MLLVYVILKFIFQFDPVSQCDHKMYTQEIDTDQFLNTSSKKNKNQTADINCNLT